MAERVRWAMGLLLGAIVLAALRRFDVAPTVSVVLAWCLLVLAPGASISRLMDLRLDRATPRLPLFDAWLEWTGLGLLAFSVTLALGDALHIPLWVLAISAPVLAAAMGPPPRFEGTMFVLRPGTIATALLLLLGLALAWGFARIPPTASDALAHLDGIRQVLSSGEPYPHVAHPDGMAGVKPDPRFGTWHAIVASVWWMGGGVLDGAWRIVALLMAGPVLIAIERVGRSLGNSAGLGALSLVAYLLLMERFEGELLGMTALPAVATRAVFGLLLCWFLRWMREIPGRREAWAFAISAAGLAMLRLDYFAMLSGTLALLVGLDLVRRRPGGLRVLLPHLVFWLLGALPFLAYKYYLSLPTPEGYLEGQRVGALLLGGEWRMANPFRLGPELLLLLAAGTVALIGLRRQLPAGSAVLLTALLLGGSMAYNPVTYRLLEPILSGPYVQRLGKLLPLYWMVALLLWMTWGFPARGWKRGLGAGTSVLALLLVANPGWSTLRSWDPRQLQGRKDAAERSVPAPLVEWLESQAGPDRMLLAAPEWAYVISGWTNLGVVAVPPSHASPWVVDAADRRRDAIQLLSGCLEESGQKQILERYEVDYVMRREPLGETPVSPDETVLFREGDWVVRSAVPLLPVGGERRCGTEVEGAAGGSWQEVLPGIHVQLEFPEPLHSSRGGRLDLAVRWWCEVENPSDPVWILRFDQEIPRGRWYDPQWNKPYRKVRELWSGARYRFRESGEPCDRQPPVFAWSPGRVYEDTLSVVIPGDIHPGSYTVRLKVLELAFKPTYSLRDVLRDDDYLSGTVVGTLVVD